MEESGSGTESIPWGRRSIHALKSFFRLVWDGVVWAVLLGGISLAGWVIVFLPRRGWEMTVPMMLYVYPALCILAFVPAMLIMRKKEPKRALNLACVGSFSLALCLTLFGDLLIPRPQFEFIKHPRLTSLNPGVVGISWDIYCFQGSFQDVIAAAKAELTPQGYLFESGRRKDPPQERWANLALPQRKDEYFTRMQLIVSEGKVTGDYFQIDGHFLESEPEPGWVTVEVIYLSEFQTTARIFLGTAP